MGSSPGALGMEGAAPTREGLAVEALTGGVDRPVSAVSRASGEGGASERLQTTSPAAMSSATPSATRPGEGFMALP
ncbi:hypothetical protein BHS09_34165 [Myxococcus xanthus]|uniref:Uncharacterized protein n=1 Tax=Myxococcus xanthus TaxID=34 RepID=A0AAE6KVK8_MYXXA|nr:hypothetical protein BHS09_34165 [Myxococcus xanthus]QDE78913.1 hypothetical protein BHS08_34190 [Myxococcus xanthus]QDF08245.1 hypothetical protein BHS04_34290 [Myxococcus xanthus]